MVLSGTPTACSPTPPDHRACGINGMLYCKLPDSGRRRTFPQASDSQLRKPSQIRGYPRYSDRGYQSRTERGSVGKD
jgi:hypothetical protein